MRTPLTSASDRNRPMPAVAGERLDRIDTALATLENEQRRLERLGLELPLARCHEERRYWSFLRAIHVVAAGEPEVGACS
jgi:hypothetical protein